MEDEIINTGGRFHDDFVVIHGNILTSMRPATSFPFALTLVELLKDKETRDEIAKKLLTDLIFKKDLSYSVD